MSDLKNQLHEDLALRNLAKTMVKQDFANLRGDVEQKGLASRFAGRMKEGAEGVVDETAHFASENPARVASVAGLGLGLLLLWLFRDTVAKFVADLGESLAEIAPDSDETE